ncbi:MAG: zf-HC2 domain-containing protein [Terriglobales bacterium]
MTEVPKIVYDRLRAVQAAGPGRTHPDPNLLAAFAEQALSATEREGVLQHLAVCGDCRELAALSLPAEEITTVPIADKTESVRATPILTKEEKNWLTSAKLIWSKPAWPRLRWAALAAGVAVVASVVVMHPGKPNPAVQTSANLQVGSSAESTAGAQIASSPAPSSVPSLPMNKSAILAKPEIARPNSAMQLSKRTRKIVPAAPSAGTFALSAPSIPKTTKTLDVAGSPPAAPAPSDEGTLMARNDAPAIEKAKPALQETEAAKESQTEATSPGQAVAPTKTRMSAARLASPVGQTFAQHALVTGAIVQQNVTFVISRGILQRSVDNGQNWQNTLHSDHPILCYASQDNDVWSGGRAGALFHSTDGGLTWTQVQPSIRADRLTSDITHIGVIHTAVHDGGSGPAEIILSTGNEETWRSADGGTNWERK